MWVKNPVKIEEGIFSEIKIFVHFFYSSTKPLLAKFSGYELDQFMENSSNQNLWVAIQFCSNSGHELDRSLENSSKTEQIVKNLVFKNSAAWHRPISEKLVHIAILKSVKLVPRYCTKTEHKKIDG